jgi:hypothetical protein
VNWERSFTEGEIAANRASDKHALIEARALRRAKEGFWARLWASVKSWF